MPFLIILAVLSLLFQYIVVGSLLSNDIEKDTKSFDSPMQCIISLIPFGLYLMMIWWLIGEIKTQISKY